MDEAIPVEEDIQFKHIITCVLGCMHSFSMLAHGQSKVRDAEQVYMKFLYGRHKKDLPNIDPKNVSSGEGDSDQPDREVKFIWV